MPPFCVPRNTRLVSFMRARPGGKQTRRKQLNERQCRVVGQPTPLSCDFPRPFPLTRSALIVCTPWAPACALFFIPGGLGVAFKLLKRGNKGKMEAQEVVVPASTSLAAQVNRNEEASREESSIIKARVSGGLAVTRTQVFATSGVSGTM